MAMDLEAYEAFEDEFMEAQEPQERFVIDDDSKADWALRKIMKAQRRKQKRAEFVQQEIERIQQWQEREDAKDDKTIEFMTSLLEEYYQKLEAEGDIRGKTYSLPHGKLYKRKRQAKLERDDKRLLEYLRESHPELVKTVESPDWGKFKKLLEIVEVESVPGHVVNTVVVDTSTGAVIDAVRVVEAERDEFGVKVDEGGAE